MLLAKLVFLPAVALFAAQVQVAAELTPGLKAGIDRFAQMHSGITTEASKVPVASLPLSMLWNPDQRIDLSAHVPWTGSGPTAVCSIPLLELRIDHPERFASRKAELPGTLDEMPRAKAPVCGTFLASLR